MSARRSSTDSVPVTVTYTAAGAVTIAPWKVEARKGQGIDWAFVGCSGRITRKSPFKGLPFDGPLPKEPKKKVKSPPTKKTGTFPYNIHLELPGVRKKGKKNRIKIDPEMIIRR